MDTCSKFLVQKALVMKVRGNLSTTEKLSRNFLVSLERCNFTIRGIIPNALSEKRQILVELE